MNTVQLTKLALKDLRNGLNLNAVNSGIYKDPRGYYEALHVFLPGPFSLVLYFDRSPIDKYFKITYIVVDETDYKYHEAEHDYIPMNRLDNIFIEYGDGRSHVQGWKNYQNEDQLFGECGETDLTLYMPNTLDEINRIINKYKNKENNT